MFHASIGRAIGLDIEAGKADETLGIGGPIVVYLHEIHLYAPGGIITTSAGFADQFPVAGLLGMRGFFDHFKVVFDPTAQRCEVERIYQKI